MFTQSLDAKVVPGMSGRYVFEVLRDPAGWHMANGSDAIG